MFELYTEQFNYLEQKWEHWIKVHIYDYITEFVHDGYYDISPNNKEKSVWIIDTISPELYDPIIKQFIEFSLPSITDNEDDIWLEYITTPKEFLYILQYVQEKQHCLFNFELYRVMKKFIYYLTIDLIKKQNIYVLEPFIWVVRVNKERLKERRIVGAMCLNRISGFDANINTHIIQFLR